MDAVDVSHPERLRAQAARLAADRTVDLLGTRVRLVGEGLAAAGMRAYVAWLNGLLHHDAIVRDLYVESPLAHPSVMMRREMLSRLGGYRAFEGPEPVQRPQPRKRREQVGQRRPPVGAQPPLLR